VEEISLLTRQLLVRLWIILLDSSHIFGGWIAGPDVMMRMQSDLHVKSKESYRFEGGTRDVRDDYDEFTTSYSVTELKNRSAEE
jgi:hypothetical protein